MDWEDNDITPARQIYERQYEVPVLHHDTHGDAVIGGHDPMRSEGDDAYDDPWNDRKEAW